MGDTRMSSPWSSKVVAVMTTTTLIMALIASSSWAAVEAGRVFQSSDVVETLASSSSKSRLSACAGDAPVTLFVFGASYMDVGENFAAMPFRSPSDFSPYGVDFFNGSATGRHSNGRLIIDHILEGLGQELLSPYLWNAGTNFEHGVSFASSGAKACNSSIQGDGSSSSGLFSLSVQVDQFRVFRQQAFCMHKSKKDVQKFYPTPEAFSTGVYIIEIGNNDYHDVRGDQVDVLISLVLQNIELEVQRLYNEGARTIVIMDAFPSACFPFQLGIADPNLLNEDGCVIPVAKIAEQHNARLKVMVANLNVELLGVKLILFSLHDVFMSAIRKPSKFGLKYVHKACCGYGGGDYNVNMVVECGKDGILNGELQKATVCENRLEYMMWDYMHPTDAFAYHIAQAFLQGKNMQPTFYIREMCQHEQ